MQMAKRQLAQHVTVDGETYAPGDVLPDHIAEKITNPAAWTSEEEAAASEEKARAAQQPGTPDGARLAQHVTVGGETYRPDDHLPAHIAEKITNPAAWEGGKLPGDAKAATPTPGTGGEEPAGPGAREDAPDQPDTTARKAATPPTKRA
jgi:hypothetical protein